MRRTIFILCLAAACGCGAKGTAGTSTQPAPPPAQSVEQTPVADIPAAPAAQPAPATPPASTGPAVLLAFEKTPFKEALVAAMRDLLVQKGATVTVIEHSDKGFAPGDPAVYGAIFISVSGVNSTIRPWIATWLETTPAARPRVILHVTQTSAWPVNASVDTVTSASAKDDTGRLAGEYVAALLAKAAASGKPPAP